ncbi:hypothetical protein IAU60_006916 [Kwoniella sp. DSM 27419]
MVDAIILSGLTDEEEWRCADVIAYMAQGGLACRGIITVDGVLHPGFVDPNGQLVCSQCRTNDEADCVLLSSVIGFLPNGEPWAVSACSTCRAHDRSCEWDEDEGWPAGTRSAGEDPPTRSGVAPKEDESYQKQRRQTRRKARKRIHELDAVVPRRRSPNPVFKLDIPTKPTGALSSIERIGHDQYTIGSLKERARILELCRGSSQSLDQPDIDTMSKNSEIRDHTNDPPNGDTTPTTLQDMLSIVQNLQTMVDTGLRTMSKRIAELEARQCTCDHACEEDPMQPLGRLCIFMFIG